MPTLAEKAAKKPTPELQAIADEVQDIANASQSFAYRFEDLDDGSRIEIRCAPVPCLTQLPDGPVDLAGSLALVDDRLLEVHPHSAVDRARRELHDRITVCDDVLASDPDHQDATIERAAAQAALEHLDERLAAGEQTGTHVAIPADAKTTAFHDELGPGGRAFIAH